ncbi:potassium-transporting ATPase subunit B, partial [Halomonas sp. ND22Bw]
DLAAGADGLAFSGQIILWLWFTLIFANFAEALAEGRGKAQAASLRKVKQDTTAHRITMSGAIESVSGTELVVGDRVIVVAGEVIPGDGD